MKKIYSFFFSSRLMAIIFVVFFVSIAVATFIENDFGSPTARAVVYNSWWFELMLLIGIVNLTGTIFIKKLYKRDKFPVFIFHFAFLVILLGAAITHYFGYEGVMHIRQGETSNKIVSSSAYFSAFANDHGKEVYAEKPVNFSALSDNKYELRFPALSNLKVECLKIVPNASERVAEVPNGEPVIELVLAGQGGRQTVVVSNNQSRRAGSLLFSLNDSTNLDGVNISTTEEGLMFRAGVHATSMSMATQMQDSLSKGALHPLMLRTLYNFEGVQVVARSYMLSGKVEIEPIKDAKPDEHPDALYIKATAGGQSKTVAYFARRNAYNDPLRIDLGGVSFSVSYGSKVLVLPFSLQLKKFIVEHYPGSQSPSWFESKIVLNDPGEKLEEERRVFMNNVLQHKGYRFYQSSYDTDGLGTIFSVNFDFWGTFVTYFGYLMLAIGFILTFFNRNSRFRKLSAEFSRLREARKMVTALFVMLAAGSVGAFAQPSAVPDSMKIDIRHAAEFGSLLLQDPGGRVKPINTLSSELLRKVSRKTWLMGQSSDQVMLGMMVYPGFWQQVPMIRVSHPEVQKVLGIRGKYVAFANIIDHKSSNHAYLLGKYVEEAYKKKPALRSQFDHEVIRVDERINLCYMVYTGEMLRIFPTHGDVSRTWVSPVDTRAKFSGKDSVLVSTIIPIYFRTLRDAAITKNGTLPAEALGVLRDFQLKYGSDVMPPAFKVKLEVWYNRIDIFDRLGSIYGLVGFVLLLFQFLSVFFPRFNLKPFIYVATGFVILAFVLHIAGLAARWYISGHAPWSNAYESLIYIAFATVLAGLIFSRKSGIALSSTALLAWLILFVAHLNWMDPEITNLPPVLKSYWLLIHVAIITASYGFLALGALMAFINLAFMSTQSKSNYSVTKNIMAELSIIIEMTLIVGLFMLTIGTFLGGVWANESWGRYWGWDAKETWALVSVMVYAFILHMRLVPGLKSNYLFNLFALVGFSSIIMTYFGVNYYLSGLHSYAKGDPLPIPVFIYYTLAVVLFVAIVAFANQQRVKRILATGGDVKPLDSQGV